MRPRIAIPMNFRPPQGADPAQAYLNDAYVQAVLDAGGLPVLVPPGERFDESLAAQYPMDGLLLTGGADLDPALYGQAAHPRITPLAPRRQAAELGWFALARRRGVPILGICLGCQVINVACGGGLIQHLPDQPELLDHGQAGRSAFHEIEILGERLRGILGASVPPVNSRHRQAVDAVGTGLRIAARSRDGVVEAVEATDGTMLLGVQWHPEDLPDHPATRALFRTLVQAAGSRGQRQLAGAE